MKNPKEILNDAIKATLFGKFYEEILREWFKNVKGYRIKETKPRIFWEEIESVKVKENWNEEMLNLADRFNEALKNLKQKRKFCIPDGLVEKNGKYYVWEAKNWPIWPEKLSNVLYSIPQLLATKVKHRTKEINIDGFIFFWWSKPEGEELIKVESLIKNINQMIEPNTFEIFYTAKILKECIENKYDWYLKIIDSEKQRIDELFKDLRGEE